MQVNNWFLRNPEQPTHVKEAAGKASNDQISTEGALGTSTVPFFIQTLQYLPLV